MRVANQVNGYFKSVTTSPGYEIQTTGNILSHGQPHRESKEAPWKTPL